MQPRTLPLMWLALASVCVACSSPPAPVTASPPSDPSTSRHSEIGPCETDGECRLEDNCGCACDPLLRNVRRDRPACEETCRGNGCAGKVARCNPSTHQCEAAPAPESAAQLPAAPS